MQVKYYHAVALATLIGVAACSAPMASAESLYASGTTVPETRDAAPTYTSATSPVRFSRSLTSQNANYLPSAQTAAQDIVVYNFNDASTNTADAGDTNTAALLSVDRGSGTLTTTFNVDDIASTAGTPVNAGINSGGATDPAGAALVLSPGFSTPDNNGSNITLAASTLGFTNLVLSFAAERTSTGFSSNQFQYSLNGTTYTNFGTVFDVPVISRGSNPYISNQFDLSTITGLNNNTQASFRIVFNGGTGSGNIRLDNLRLTGSSTVIAAPEPGTNLALLTGSLLLAWKLFCARTRLIIQTLTRIKTIE